jgi:hypothetical protein
VVLVAATELVGRLVQLGLPAPVFLVAMVSVAPEAMGVILVEWVVPVPDQARVAPASPVAGLVVAVVAMVVAEQAAAMVTTLAVVVVEVQALLAPRSRLQVTLESRARSAAPGQS